MFKKKKRRFDFYDPKCPECKATGVVNIVVTCNDCKGKGLVANNTMTCMKCKGKGNVSIEQVCSVCLGKKVKDDAVKCVSCGFYIKKTWKRCQLCNAINETYQERSVEEKKKDEKITIPIENMQVKPTLFSKLASVFRKS